MAKTITIPEVETFIEAKRAVEDFEVMNEPVFERYRELTAEYNRSLEQADKAVRASGGSSGPFVLSHTVTKIDSAKLYELVGRDEFLRLGGKLETVVQYSVDKTKFTSLASSGQVPKDLAAAVTIEVPNYKAPKPIKLPVKNSWEREISMESKLQSEAGPIEPYRDLLTQPKGPIAHVSMTVGFSKEYGAMKVSATVSLACDQNEKMINKAGERAFDKAVELVEDGWRELEKKLSAGPG